MMHFNVNSGKKPNVLKHSRPARSQRPRPNPSTNASFKKSRVAGPPTKRQAWPRPRPLRSRSHSMIEMSRGSASLHFATRILTRTCSTSSALGSFHGGSWSRASRLWSRSKITNVSNESEHGLRRVLQALSFLHVCSSTKTRRGSALKITWKPPTQPWKKARSASPSSHPAPDPCRTSSEFKRHL